MVDYCLVPLDCYHKFSDFCVRDILQVADDHNINIPAKIPDHSLLSWNVGISIITNLSNLSSTTSQAKPKLFRSIPEGYMQSEEAHVKINNLIDKLEYASSQTNINDIYNQFCNIINSELFTKKYKPNHRKHKPWWSPDLSLLRKTAKATRISWLNEKNNREKKQRFLDAQKTFDKHVSKIKAKYYRDQQKGLVDSICSNPRLFWKKIKELGSQRHKDKELPRNILDSVNKSLVTDSQQVLEVWKEYFKSLLNNNQITPSPQLDTNSALSGDSVHHLNKPFSIQEIEFALNKINSNSAPGPDELRVGYIDNPLCASFLFNTCLTMGVAPLPWLCSFIKPIFKPGGNSLDPSDYRGISLQSVVPKILCSVMNTRLCEHLEINDLLAEEQNGFRSGRSCQDHIFSLHTLVHNGKLIGLDTHAVFIDFIKAFDSVNRHLLWEKLQHQFGKNGQFLSLLKGLYKKVVKVNEELTDWFDIETGVKQGCILSPILFSMFINDLTIDIKSANRGINFEGLNISSLLYADDVVVFAEPPQDLQQMLDCIDRWCQKWGININPKKTKAMHFRHKRRLITRHTLSIGSAPVDYCHEYRYLGYWINEYLNMEESLQKVLTEPIWR